MTLPLFSQTDAKDRWTHAFSIGITASKMNGDLSDSNKEYASQQSLIYGQTASYNRTSALGFAVQHRSTFWSTKFLGFGGGMGFSTRAVSEVLEIGYQPPTFGIISLERSITNRLLLLEPQLGIDLKWKGFGLTASLAANIFVTGRTEWANTLSFQDGTVEGDKAIVKLDTQDPPIFLDPQEAGGIVDYTYLKPANHGANPIWLSTDISASYTLWSNRPSPFVSFATKLPLMEAIRSRTPIYSLRSGVQSPYLDDINLGTIVTSASISIGYRF